MDFAIWLFATRNTEIVLKQNTCLTVNVYTQNKEIKIKGTEHSTCSLMEL